MLFRSLLLLSKGRCSGQLQKALHMGDGTGGAAVQAHVEITTLCIENVPRSYTYGEIRAALEEHMGRLQYNFLLLTREGTSVHCIINFRGCDEAKLCLQKLPSQPWLGIREAEPVTVHEAKFQGLSLNLAYFVLCDLGVSSAPPLIFDESDMRMQTRDAVTKYCSGNDFARALLEFNSQESISGGGKQRSTSQTPSVSSASSISSPSKPRSAASVGKEQRRAAERHRNVMDVFTMRTLAHRFPGESKSDTTSNSTASSSSGSREAGDSVTTGCFIANWLFQVEAEDCRAGALPYCLASLASVQDATGESRAELKSSSGDGWSKTLAMLGPSTRSSSSQSDASSAVGVGMRQRRATERQVNHMAGAGAINAPAETNSRDNHTSASVVGSMRSVSDAPSRRDSNLTVDARSSRDGVTDNEEAPVAPSRSAASSSYFRANVVMQDVHFSLMSLSVTDTEPEMFSQFATSTGSSSHTSSCHSDSSGYKRPKWLDEMMDLSQSTGTRQQAIARVCMRKPKPYHIPSCKFFPKPQEYHQKPEAVEH